MHTNFKFIIKVKFKSNGFGYNINTTSLIIVNTTLKKNVELEKQLNDCEKFLTISGLKSQTFECADAIFGLLNKFV